MELYLQEDLRVRPSDLGVDSRFAKDAAWAVAEGVRVGSLLRTVSDGGIRVSLRPVECDLNDRSKNNPHLRSAFIGLFLASAITPSLLRGATDRRNAIVHSLFARTQHELTTSFLSFGEEGRAILASMEADSQNVRHNLRGAYAVAMLARELSGIGEVFLSPQELDLYYSIDLFFRYKQRAGWCVQVKATQDRPLVLTTVMEAGRSSRATSAIYEKLYGHVRHLNERHACSWRPMCVWLSMGVPFASAPIHGIEDVRQLVAA